jgi:hypothetical protein
MACQVHCSTLVRLLEQLAAVQGGFGNEGIIILLSKTPGTLQRSSNNAHCLELASAITDTVFVYRKGLSEEFVCKFFETTLIGYLSAGDEQPEAEFRRRWRNPSVESGEQLVHKAVQSRRLC